MATAPWSDGAAAIVAMFLAGQETGHAWADVLLGDVNPSGKLPLTFPNKENEQDFATSQWPGYGKSSTGQSPGYANYSEKLLVGYRWYDEHNVTFTTGFPFGHGLSYSTFKYSGIQASSTSVTATVENSGSVAGGKIFVFCKNTIFFCKAKILFFCKSARHFYRNGPDSREGSALQIMKSNRLL